MQLDPLFLNVLDAPPKQYPINTEVATTILKELLFPSCCKLEREIILINQVVSRRLDRLNNTKSFSLVCGEFIYTHSLVVYLRLLRDEFSGS